MPASPGQAVCKNCEIKYDQSRYIQYSGKKPTEKCWKKIFKRFILCQKHYYWGIYNLQYHPKNCSRKLKAMIIINVHLFLVIKPSYSCSFVTLLILACIDWLED